MSDYLGNLLTRTFATGTGIRPRVPSLFEPPTVSIQTSAPTSLEQEAEAASSFLVPAPADEIAPQTGPVATPAARPDAPGVINPQASSTGLRDAPVSRTRSALRPRESMPNSPTEPSNGKTTEQAVARIRPEPPDSPPEISETLAARRPASQPKAESPTRSIIVNKLIAPPAHLPDAPPVSIKKASDNNLSAPVAHPPTAPRPVERRETAAPLRPLVGPRPPQTFLPVQPVRPSRPASPGMAPRLPPPAGPPAIHVTIGRIEVRANAAPAPSRPRRAAVPILNLEDYLRGRAGEGGR